MATTYSHNFDTPVFKGVATVNTGLLINGEWVAPVEGGDIEVINPASGEVITKVAIGTKADVDKAVDAARKAYKTAWGLKVPARVRERLLTKLADLMERDVDELAALESLNAGKPYALSKMVDIGGAIEAFRYFAGWADKLQGDTIEAGEGQLNYTRREPFGVCGQIVPWNFPLVMLAWKVAPALATGNCIILKPSELTPLTALKVGALAVEAGYPPGVFNIIVGYGHAAGQAISEHPGIDKVAFTGSTLTGRRIMKAAAESNLKVVTLELGGKSPTIVFDDANLEAAIGAAANGIFFNMGQLCVAGSRIFVQEGIYDKVVAGLTAIAQGLGTAIGDPFNPDTKHGPQISKTQFERVMGYIESGKSDGAKVAVGGAAHGNTGYFIQPTVFTDVTPEMKIVKEEIFGPVATIIKFKTEEEVIEMANNTVYGLAAYVFSGDVGRAIRVANQLEAGTLGINTTNAVHFGIPFGGYKQSGIGKELGKYGLEAYTQIKGMFVSL